MSAAPIERLLATVAADSLRARRQAASVFIPAPRDNRDPGLVLSSPHGAAVHLACALGVPWLPMAGPWPGVSGPGGSGPLLLIHGPSELDGPARARLEERFHAGGRPVWDVQYGDPDAFSAAVADLYRQWLRALGSTGNRLIVECGRLIDPWQVLRAGLVPYWCPDPAEETVRRLTWWIAGSEPFSSVEALPEPPGAAPDDVAPLCSWKAVTAFATRRGVIDPKCARRYPAGRVSPSHATRVLREHPYELPYPPTMEFEVALQALASGSGGIVVR